MPFIPFRVSFFIAGFILYSLCVSGQNAVTDLKIRLDSLHYKDQVLRELLSPSCPPEKKEQVLAGFGFEQAAFDADPWTFIIRVDSLNLAEVRDILNEYGYPGKSTVGEPANITVWLVIQHSNEIPEYLPMIRTAGEAGEIGMDLVAMMEDRKLMYENKEQIYGSQYSFYPCKGDHGEEKMVPYIWPVADPAGVNERRKAAGFTETVEEYARRCGFEYKILGFDTLSGLCN